MMTRVDERKRKEGDVVKRLNASLSFISSMKVATWAASGLSITSFGSVGLLLFDKSLSVPFQAPLSLPVRIGSPCKRRAS
jgi:hypothetical protein